MKTVSHIIVLIIILSSLVGCAGTRSLEEGELLYKKTKVTFANPESVNDKGKVTSDLLSLSRLKPNSGLFKLRLGLYNMVKKPKKKKGFRNWLKNKVGQPPSLYQEPLVYRTRLLMEKYLKDEGYFGSEVVYDTLVRRKKVSVNYTVNSKGQYRVGDIHRPSDTSTIGKLLKGHEEKTVLKKGKYYNLSDLDAERARLAEVANNNGFFDFNTGYIYYFVDTALGNRNADIYLEIQPAENNTEHDISCLDNDLVFPEYDLNDPNTQSFEDTITYKGITLVRDNKILRRGVYHYILHRADSLYSKKVQDQTVNHLLNLGIFKFVSLKYHKKQGQNAILLDRQFYLTPNKIQNITAELEVNNRTGNYLGTAATLTYVHKNLFHGAEHLFLSASGGLETQLGNKENLINSADINFQLDLTVPRFLFPFRYSKEPGAFLPYTKLTLNTIFQRRTQFYTVASSGIKFGYNWKSSPKVSHEIFPISASNVTILSTTPNFDSLLFDNPRLRSGFENVLLAGVNYTFTFSNQNLKARDSYSFFKGDVQTSGNFLYGISRPFTGKKDEPLKLFGVPLSNFSKLTMDFRHYLYLNKSQLVFRILTGMGFATGPSEVMPYPEQYFIGGSNSLRAFRLRELGPGSYVNPDNSEISGNSEFFDQTGDIKLEMNAEFRFPMFSYLKGAIFVDAGNVWLTKDNGQPEGVFHFNRFYREIAIGTGLGLRIDFDYLVIRLDGSFALRRPFEETGFEWTFKSIELGSREWRKKNLIWNIAIGYPF